MRTRTRRYASLITSSIRNSGPERRLTLNGIYEWIIKNYPYYTETGKGWKASVTHVVSFGKRTACGFTQRATPSTWAPSLLGLLRGWGG
jgi:hypothetical protein